MSYRPKYIMKKELSDDEDSDTIPLPSKFKEIKCNKKVNLDEFDDSASESSVEEKFVSKITDAPKLKLRKLPPIKFESLYGPKIKSAIKDIPKENRYKANSFCINAHLEKRFGIPLIQSIISGYKNPNLKKNKTINTTNCTKKNLLILKNLQMECN